MGFDTSTTLALQSGNSLLAVVAEILCMVFVDRLGRRRPLIISFAFSGATLVIMAALTGAFGTTNAAASRAFVAMTWLFNFAFSAGVGPLAWAVPVEMFGSRHRRRSQAPRSGSRTSWSRRSRRSHSTRSSGGTGSCTPSARSRAPSGFGYVLLALLPICVLIHFQAFLPETRGLPLEEVDAYFSKVPLFVPHSTVPVPAQAEREDALRKRGAEMSGTTSSIDESLDEKAPIEV
jgi:MFS family permease